MGAHGSKSKKGLKKKYTKSSLESLAKMTHFTPEQIETLYIHFKSISNSDSSDNKISVKEFEQALGLPSTAFTRRIFSAFDTDGSAEIEFDEFILGLSAMSPQATIEEKAQFCFGVYDIDGNGSIEKEELKQILTFSLSGNESVHLSEAQINAVVDSTFKQMDSDGNGGISFDEFLAAANKNPAILSCVNLKVDDIFNKNK
ncbi:Calcineurin B-like protein 8 [Tritrichomonas foetus]|uniref:Calcineurin B-like protein 8 n=1 Tax=Tritrichomonas foetus TaxID=1144522 RepID=A0A1J4IZY8_9EUKA|nr:Calcineurin B-like protein 8 [Tritrichomonas foetus]|eukprot:OHS92746.1 Calcineurin B-like protein 8 [Tritrichomonas foetus]